MPEEAQTQEEAQQSHGIAMSPMEAALEREKAKATGDEDLSEMGGLDEAALKAARDADAAASGKQDLEEEAPAKPAKKEPEKQGEATVEEGGEEEQPEEAPESPLDWKPKGKAKENFQRLNQALDAKTAEINQLKQQLEAHPELKKTKEELEYYRDIVRKVAIEKDPEFSQKFDTRRNVAVQAAKQAAGEKGSEIEGLLKQPPSQYRDAALDKLMEDLPASVQRRVNAALGTLDQIDIERQGEIESRKSSWDATQAQSMQQQTRQQQERQQNLQKAFESTLKEWSDPERGMPFFTPGETEESKAEVQERIELAKSIFAGKLSERELAMASLWASVGPSALEMLNAERTAHAATKKQVAKLRGVQPDDTGGRREAQRERVIQPGDTGYEEEFAAQLEAARIQDAARG